jgi:hypothetical protein
MDRLSLRDGGGGGTATAPATAPLAIGRAGAGVDATASGGGRPTHPIALLPPAAVRHVRETFGELLATSPSSLILSLGPGSLGRSASASAGGTTLAAASAGEPPRGSGSSFDSVQYEAAMWDAFAQVYTAEVEARIAAAQEDPSQQQQQQQDSGPAPAAPLPAAPSAAAASGGAPRDAQLSVEARRQVLADILVWAEVTRPGYDAAAADFVTSPHASDAAFRRVGEALKRAKEERGLA